MVDNTLSEEIQAVLVEACRRLDVDPGGVELLRQHSNTSFKVPERRLLVRIAGSTTAHGRVAGSLRVTRWLANRGYPTVRPASVPGQPWLIRQHTVSVWQLEDVADDAATGAELGGLLAELHRQPVPPFEVRRLDDPLTSVAAALDRAPDAIPDEDVAWLQRRVTELRETWRSLDHTRPACLVHGDAHPNNVLRLNDGRLLLSDWDHVAIGPPEWDLIQPLYTRRRFGRPDESDVEAFAAAYGWDVRSWDGAERLLAVREVTGLSPYIRNAGEDEWSLGELVRRVRGLRAGDTEMCWGSPSRR